MGAHTQKVQPTNQATPLGRDVTNFLRERLTGARGGDSFAITPLQREAGTAQRQFVNALQSAPDMRIRDVPSTEGVRETLREGTARSVGREAADLRESFGARGARFGSSLLGAETELRSNAMRDLSDRLVQLEFESGLAGINRDVQQSQLGLQQNQQLMQAIQGLQQMGTQNFQPFLQLGGAGITNQEVIASPNPLLQLGTAIIQGTGQAFGQA